MCLSHQVSQPEVSLYAEVIDSLEVDFTFLKSECSLNHHHKVIVSLKRYSLLSPHYGNYETVYDYWLPDSNQIST